MPTFGDSFARLPGGSATSLGTQWAEVPNVNDPTSPEFQISGNAAVPQNQSSLALNMAIVSQLPPSSDLSVSANVTLSSSAPFGSYGGVLARLGNNSNQAYVGVLENHTATALWLLCRPGAAHQHPQRQQRPAPGRRQSWGSTSAPT